MKCAICGTEESIINHHTSYDPEETVPLCRSCHMKLHNGSLKSDILAPTLPYPIQVTVQLSKVDENKIKFLVEQGHILNRADFTRNAVRKHLNNFSFPDNLEAEGLRGKTPKEIYDDAVDQAWKTYMEIKDQALKTYKEAEAPALKTDMDIKNSVWKAYKEIMGQTLTAYYEVMDQAWKTYTEVMDQARKAYKEAEG